MTLLLQFLIPYCICDNGFFSKVPLNINIAAGASMIFFAFCAYLFIRQTYYQRPKKIDQVSTSNQSGYDSFHKSRFVGLKIGNRNYLNVPKHIADSVKSACDFNSREPTN